MENNWLNLMNLLKKYFNIDRDTRLHEEQAKIFNELIGEKSSEFFIQKK